MKSKATTCKLGYAVNGVNGSVSGNFGTKGVSDSSGKQTGPDGKFVGQTKTKNTYPTKGV